MVSSIVQVYSHILAENNLRFHSFPPSSCIFYGILNLTNLTPGACACTLPLKGLSELARPLWPAFYNPHSTPKYCLKSLKKIHSFLIFTPTAIVMHSRPRSFFC